MDDIKNVFDKIEKAESILKDLEKKREEKAPEKSTASKLSKEHQNTIDSARHTLASIKEKLGKELAVRTLELDKCQEELVLLQTRLKVGEITEDVFQTKSKHLVEKIKSLEKKVIDTQNLINAKFAEDVAPIIESDKPVSVPEPEHVPAAKEEPKQAAQEEAKPALSEEVKAEVPGEAKPAIQEEVKQASPEEAKPVQQEELKPVPAMPTNPETDMIRTAPEGIPAAQKVDFKPPEAAPAVAETAKPEQAEIKPVEAEAVKPESAEAAVEAKPAETAAPLVSKAAAPAAAAKEAVPVKEETTEIRLKKEDKKPEKEDKSKQGEKEPVTLKQHKPTFHLHPLNEPPRKKDAAMKTGLMGKNRALWVIIAAVIAGLALVAMITLIIPRTGSQVGNQAPDFVMQLSSENMTALSSFRGTNVMLVFWDRDFWDNQFFYVNGVVRKLYTPDRLNQIYENVPRSELAIIAIASGTSNSEIDKLIKDYNVKFPVIVDSFGKLRSGYNITEEPTYIFVDKGGVIRARVEGPLTNLSALEQVVYAITKRAEVKPVKPPITDVMIQAATEKSAVINWSTTSATTTQVDIDGKNIQTVITASPTTLHSMTLRDLEPGASYHVRIVYNVNNINVSEHSFGALNETIVSKRYNVTTTNKDTVYPEISGISTSFITDSSISVSWKTDEPTTGNVDYGTAKDYKNTATQGSNMSIWHTVKIDGLKPDTAYSLKLRSRDASGKEAVQELEAVKTTAMVETAPVLGKRAPNFTLSSLDGTRFTLNQFQGKRVLLVFWLEGCAPCELEMPIIEKAFNKYNRDELIILAVNVRGDVDKVKYYVQAQKFTFPVLLDTQGEADSTYRAPYFPTSYFIDSKGIIRKIVGERFQSISEIDDILSKLE